MSKKPFTFEFPKGQVQKFVRKVENENNIAISRTLNIISNQAINQTSGEIAEDTGINKTSVKKRIKVTRSTRVRLYFEWFISGLRMALIKPKTIRGGGKKRGGNRTGISYIDPEENKRKRITDYVDGGSKPFLIPVNRTEYGKKVTKLAVYREKGMKRVVTKMAGYSLPTLIRKDWYGNTLEFLTKRLPEEYRKQLKKAKYN